jgi:peptidyl-prolyl cis-trans isomerase C
MKPRLLIVFTCAAAAFLAAQTPAPKPVPAPATPPPQAPVVAPGPAAPAAPIPPDAIVVTVDGKSYTAKEMDGLMSLLPPQAKVAVSKNPEQGLAQLFIMNALSEEAKKKKLDQVSPTKEAIESRQRQYLAQIVVQDQNTHIKVNDAEEQAYYDAHKEAKAKAEDYVKQLRAGGDFAKLATEKSDDKESAKKGGEYATIKRADNYPAAIKDAIFKLKDGEISDPVKQPAGYYVFKVTERHQQEFKEIQNSLFERVKQEKYNDWLKGMQQALAPKIDTPEYFRGPAPSTGTSTSIATLPMPISPETVVATVSGKPYTAKQIDEYQKLLPPQGRAAMKQNPEAGLTQLFLIIQLSDEAKKRKLDEESPNKESLELFSREILATGYVTEERNTMTVSPAEQETYYKGHSAEFESAKVSAILVSFSPNPKPAADGKTPRNEADAKTRAEDLVKQLRGGADFAQVAKESSDDKDSAAKGGEYATIRRTAQYPQATKDVVFALKPGEISDPVRQPSGFYIFKSTSKDVQPLPEAAPVIIAKLKQEKFQEWITGLQKQYKPKIEKPDYFRK